MDITICPKCGIILKPKEENDLLFLECTVCGYKKEYTSWMEHTCTSCGYQKAIVVLNEIVLGDEDWVTIYRCVKCGNTDKEGFGT